jgi:hypothetical protein
MSAKVKISIIFKAIVIALMWMLIVTYTTFPQLFKNPVSFLAEHISFENTGKFLLFGIGIYIFDLCVHILYFADQQVKKNLLIVGALGCGVLSVLIVPLAIDMEMNRTTPILIVGIPMWLLKSFNLYCNEDIVAHNANMYKK